MSLYKRGDMWWFKFQWDGRTIRESTRHTDRRKAENVEAARRAAFANGAAGIKEAGPMLTLEELAEQHFVPFIETQKADKKSTVTFYKNRIKRLRTFPRLWRRRLDQIEPEDITAYIKARRAMGMEISTVNRDLATLRRMFKLAQEWGKAKALPKVR